MTINISVSVSVSVFTCTAGQCWMFSGNEDLLVCHRPETENGQMQQLSMSGIKTQSFGWELSTLSYTVPTYVYSLYILGVNDKSWCFIKLNVSFLYFRLMTSIAF